MLSSVDLSWLIATADTQKGSFALAYPLSRQSRAGIGYKAGKSDTPSLLGFPFRFQWPQENFNDPRARWRLAMGISFLLRRRLQRRQWVRRVLPIFNIRAGMFYS